MLTKKEYLEKKEYYETQIQKEVEKLKILIETDNILYIDLDPITNKINTCKIMLKTLESNKEIDYLFNNEEWE